VVEEDISFGVSGKKRGRGVESRVGCYCSAGGRCYNSREYNSVIALVTTHGPNTACC